ncbi:MAG: nucleotidyltransferase domain-containing protein [Candidatus Baldrarchaeia archaeon]|nr:nucleotidyltransferase domain-containing protein [Candidatus Baldrarchaeota archaeon]
MKPNDFDFGETWRGEKVNKILKRWLKEVSQRTTLKMVIAFGSRVKGKAKPWSDLDLLVVVKKAPKGLARWLNFRVPGCEVIEPRVYAEDEFFKALKELDLTILEALHHGILIFDDGFYKKAFEEFSKVVEKWELRREKIGWISLKKLKLSAETKT